MPGEHFIASEGIANARRNIERMYWAAAERDAAVDHARRWLDLDDDTLWSLVTGQTTGRSTNASVTKGCPQCGDGINRYGGAFKVDVLRDPWKIICPNCSGRFPGNDFAAFYMSGIGLDGLFHPHKADRSLLFNTQHPDKNDPLFAWCVDDGTGWTDDTGESFKLIGVYGHHGIWNEIRAACQGLKRAYLLTGSPVYARKAGILLARIADVYPDMHWSYWAGLGFFNSDGLSGRGRIYGRIWEPGLLIAFTECYDAVRSAWRDGDPLFTFLARKQIVHGLCSQNNVEELCRHIEDRIIREGIAAILAGDVARNEPGDQVTMAVLSVALDAEDTDQWLDWIFKAGKLRGEKPSGGHIPKLFAGEIDRDGIGSEAAPSYSLGWLHKSQGMNDLDRVLRCRRSYTRHNVRGYLRYKQMFLGHIRMICLGRYIPNIGDTGQTGKPNLCGLTAEQCLEGLELFGDPIFARVAHHLVGGDLTRIHGSIFNEDPEAIRRRVTETVAQHGPFRLVSDVMTGYGLTLLRDGADDTERTLWLYYGRNTGHGHADRLNLGLYGFGLDLMPDLGYPEHARVWPKRSGWTSHTVSHNTVLVDRSKQKGGYSGKVDFCATTEEAQVVSVSSTDVYPQCSVYRRTSALVRISDADFYVADLFQVSGGSSHHFLFHAAEGIVRTEGLEFTPQDRGTYAGEDVRFGEFYDGEVRNYSGSGFQYLYDVKRCAAAAGTVSVDWTITDTWQVLPASSRPGAATDIHLRWNLINPPGEIALCHGDPPRNKPGNPRRLTYGIVAHEGEQPLDSGYLSIIEAFKRNRNIVKIEEVDLPGGPALRALRVRLQDDNIHTVIFGDGYSSIDIDGRIRFNGSFGIFAESKNGPQWAALVGGTNLGTETHGIRMAEAAWTGIVSNHEPGVIHTDEPPPNGPLSGAYISIRNENERDACYRIRSVERKSNKTFIRVGDDNFIRGMVDDLDYSKGFRYDFEPGDSFKVLHTGFDRWEK